MDSRRATWRRWQSKQTWGLLNSTICRALGGLSRGEESGDGCFVLADYRGGFGGVVSLCVSSCQLPAHDGTRLVEPIDGGMAMALPEQERKERRLSSKAR